MRMGAGSCGSDLSARYDCGGLKTANTEISKSGTMDCVHLRRNDRPRL